MTHPSTPTRTAVAPVVMAKLPKLILKSYSGSLTGGVHFGMLLRQLFMIILVLVMLISLHT